MKYQCINCEKIYDEKDIVMLNGSSGFGGTWLEPHCKNCIETYKDRVKK